MFEVKTMNKIAAIGLDEFDKTNYNVTDDAANPDAILVRSAKLHDMEFGDKLLCIARAGAGTNNIPVDRCSKEGIVVFNTPGANAMAVKELAICALLLSSRDVIGGVEWVKSISDKGDEISALVEKGKGAFVGPEISGKALGVIGLGAVGARIANAAVDLGMKVYGYDPYISVDAAWGLSSRIIHTTDINELFAKSDYITIHVPYLPSTHHFINAETIAKMRDGVRIINLARAELVSDDDIIAALTSGKVAKYVTDFPNAKTVANVPGVIAIPHLGASTPESEDNCAVMAAHEIEDYLENGNIVNSVNFGKAILSPSRNPRICIFHKNIPNMIAHITSAISARGINIDNMVNASLKGSDVAYTMLELGTEPDEDLCSDILKNDGSIRVRIIPGK